MGMPLGPGGPIVGAVSVSAWFYSDTMAMFAYGCGSACRRAQKAERVRTTRDDADPAGPVRPRPPEQSSPALPRAHLCQLGASRVSSERAGHHPRVLPEEPGARACLSCGSAGAGRGEAAAGRGKCGRIRDEGIVALVQVVYVSSPSHSLGCAVHICHAWSARVAVDSRQTDRA